NDEGPPMRLPRVRTPLSLRLSAALLAASALVAGLALRAQAPAPVLKAQADRVAVAAKVAPAVVAVMNWDRLGGFYRAAGSGVLISRDGKKGEGYALTNFHVVAGFVGQGQTPVTVCGLPDGNLYQTVLVGLDRIGDVALIKLLPLKEGQEFPF